MSIGAMGILRRVERTLRRINADSESAIAINVPQKLGHSRETNRGASGDQQCKLSGVVRMRAAREYGHVESARAANDAERKGSNEATGRWQEETTGPSAATYCHCAFGPPVHDFRGCFPIGRRRGKEEQGAKNDAGSFVPRRREGAAGQMGS